MNSEVDIIYLVDSFGALYSEQVRYLMEKYLRYAQPYGKTVGMHAHNNQQLAFANTIEALDLAGKRLDQVLSVFFSVAGADSNPKRQELQRAFSPKLADYSSEIYGNKALFARIEDNTDVIRTRVIALGA